MNSRVLVVLVGVLILFGSPPRGTAAEEQQIKVGFAVALSGWMKPWDLSWQTAELAIEDINARGGLLGREVSPFFIDTKTDVGESAKAGLEIAERGADFAVISCDFDMGAPAALATQSAELVSMSLCAVDPKMGPEGIGPLVFTAAHAGQTHGAAMAEWGYKSKGFRTAYILTNVQIEAMKSTTAGFAWAWQSLNGTRILGEDTFKGDDPSISSQITRIKNLNESPDVIWLSDFAPAGASVLRQLRAAGVNTPVMAPQGMDGSFWWEAVPNLKDFYIPVIASVHGNDPNPLIQEINERLVAKYGGAPVNSYHYYGYAVIEMWANAVERADTTDSQAVLAALEKFDNEPTLVGPMSFSPELHIQNKGRFLVLEINIENGKGMTHELGYINSPSVPKSVLLRQ